MKVAVMPATANTHQSIWIRYAKLWSHLFIAHQATGNAIKEATRTSLRNSFESICVTCDTVAPNTFLIPISLVRCSVVYVLKPNRPRQATKMVSAENIFKMVPVTCSAAYVL